MAFTFYLQRHPKIHHNGTTDIVAVQVGEKGFWQIETQADVDTLNGGKLPKDVAEGALVGSMFGWDTPGARAAIEYANERGTA